MTVDQPVPLRVRARFHLTAGSILLACASLLQGCAQPAPVGARVYAADLQGGAKQCDAPKIAPPPAGQNGEATIKLANDGGWCALSLHQPGPKPYEAGLLTVRPEHGTVLIHQVGDDTRIDYTPDKAFTGTDRFSVKLIPDNAIIHATATVTAS